MIPAIYPFLLLRYLPFSAIFPLPFVSFINSRLVPPPPNHLSFPPSPLYPHRAAFREFLPFPAFLPPLPFRSWLDLWVLRKRLRLQPDYPVARARWAVVRVWPWGGITRGEELHLVVPNTHSANWREHWFSLFLHRSLVDKHQSTVYEPYLGRDVKGFWICLGRGQETGAVGQRWNIFFVEMQRHRMETLNDNLVNRSFALVPVFRNAPIVKVWRMEILNSNFSELIVPLYRNAPIVNSQVETGLRFTLFYALTE